MILISASVIYTNSLVSKFAEKERKNVKLWADAVHRKAELMQYTENFFKQLGEEEKKKAELIAKVYNRLLNEDNSGDLTFYLDIIENNTTIPVIITDESGKILYSRNLKKGQEKIEYLKGKLKEEFSVYEPIVIEYVAGKKNYLYYKNSNLYTKLKEVLNDYITIFVEEVTQNSASVPVIITDSTKSNIIIYGNLDPQKMSDPEFARKKLKEMMGSNPPIILNFRGKDKVYIYYQSSELLTKMKWFPLAQLLIIFVFVGIAYLLFSLSRKAEQSRVWAGMAKETAHQLGTPISSLMAWTEMLKLDPSQVNEAVENMERDITRLGIITKRFSKIGSTPSLEPTNISEVLYNTFDYLKTRFASKDLEITLDLPKQDVITAANGPLFSWVLENLIKNAIDAMEGKGKISLKLSVEGNNIIIDVTDTGKGIPKSEHSDVFNPGFTTKKRGWGLGLSLAKRIIKDYHGGKIFIKQSSPGKGTTFRIVLKNMN